MSLPDRVAILNANGTTDTSFDPGLGVDDAAYAVGVLPSGKVVVGGAFTQANVETRPKLVVFETDGALDPLFDVTPNNTVRTLALQTDGSVILGGEFTSVNGTTRNRIARLESDLTLEAAYDPNAGGTVYGLLNQEDGKTVAVGAFTTMGGVARNRIARLYNDTAATTLSVLSVDLVQWLRSGASSETERVSFELSTDGGTTYADIAGTITRSIGGWQLVPSSSLTGNGIIRARAYPTDSHSEGVMEDTVAFDVNPEIQVSQGVTILTDAVSTVAFDDLQLGSTTDIVITIANIGLDDLILSGTPKIALTTGTQWSVVSQPSSPIAYGSSVNFTLRFAPTSTGVKSDTVTIANDDADENPFTFGLTGTCTPGPGSSDSTWQPVSNNVVRTSAQDAGDETWVGGSFTTVNALNRLRLARLDTSGNVQNQTGSIANGEVLCFCQLPNGKVLAGGTFTSVSGVVRNRLARFNADGSFDATFNIAANAAVTSLALQADGAVIVGGAFTTLGGASRFGLAKLTPTGTLDPTFGRNTFGTSVGIITQTDGKVILFGDMVVPTPVSGDGNYMVRLNADGSVDSTFLPKPNAPVNAAAITSDGKVLAGGPYTVIGAASKTGLNRVTSTGAHDSAFAEVAAAVQSIMVQCDGKVLAGSYTAGALASTERLVRLSTAGVNDSTFVATARNAVYGLSMQSDGKVIVTGNFTLAGGATKYAARLINDLIETEDGSVSAAISELSVISPTEVQWQRGGTLPDCQIVVFDFSQDGGTTWTRLGQATRITGGWSLSSITLPISGILRAQAYIPCGYYNGSTSIHEEQVSFSNLEVADLVIELTSVDGSTIADGGTVAFPGTLPGQSSDIVFTLRNTGNATLSSIAATATGDFSITSSPAASIAANGSTTMTVRFTPTTIGARGPAVLSVTSSLPGAKNPYAIGLNGNGVTVPLATTGANSAPASGQRTLNGTFRANHDTATAYFQYKLASSSTWLNSGSSTISGFTNVAVSKTITGLTVGQSYQYRAITYNAVNAGQTPASPFAGAITTFTAT